jgi:hypothetical protein
MFVLLIISFYNFLIGSGGEGPDKYVDIYGVLIMTISISAAPGIILAGIAFGLSRNYGNRFTSLVLSFAGIIIIIGMIISINLTQKINSEFYQPILIIVPYIFIFGGIGVLIIGLFLYIKYRKMVNGERRLN